MARYPSTTQAPQSQAAQAAPNKVFFLLNKNPKLTFIATEQEAE
jgi:hypothetical protein